MIGGQPLSGSDRRLYGLDVFRSIAVLFVVTGHTLEHSTIPDVVRRLGSIGGFGVEMFFVLSGFLIGGILLNLVDAGRLHSPSDLRGFWARRWLRTLPMYVVAMIAFLRFDYLGRHSLTDYLPYWIFMQNFAWPISKFFGLSWSLAIEEHFYLWFPMIFLAIHSFFRVNYASFVLSCIVMALVSILYRWSLPFFTDFNEFNYHSRMVVLAHLDGIAAGVATALIQRKAIGIFRAIGSLFPIWLVMGTAIIAWSLVGLPGFMASRGLQIFILTGESIVFALLIPWFCTLQSVTNSTSARFFRFTSRISYSMYLMHILVIILVNKYLAHWGVFDLVYNQPTALYPIYFSGYFAVSWLTYCLVERPFMEIRDEAVSARRIAAKAWPAALIAFGIAAFA